MSNGAAPEARDWSGAFAVCYVALGAAAPGFVDGIKHGHAWRTAATAIIMVTVLVCLYRFTPSAWWGRLPKTMTASNPWIATAIFIPMLAAFYGVLLTGSWVGALAAIIGVIVYSVAAVGVLLFRSMA